jgi:hypothetical protein
MMSMSMSSSNISPLTCPLVRCPPPSFRGLLPSVHIITLIYTILSARIVTSTDSHRTPLPVDGVDNAHDEDVEAPEIALDDEYEQNAADVVLEPNSVKTLKSDL